MIKKRFFFLSEQHRTSSLSGDEICDQFLSFIFHLDTVEKRVFSFGGPQIEVQYCSASYVCTNEKDVRLIHKLLLGLKSVCHNVNCRSYLININKFFRRTVQIFTSRVNPFSNTFVHRSFLLRIYQKENIFFFFTLQQQQLYVTCILNVHYDRVVSK